MFHDDVIDWPLLAALEGLISEQVGRRLATLAAQVRPPAVIVEIGSYRGKSTAYLASGAIAGAGARVIAIDPWDLPGNPGGRFGFDLYGTHAAFHRQLGIARVAEQVEAKQAFSTEAAKDWNRPIGLLYVDGSHTEADVRADWGAWEPHLADRAVVVFDDYHTPRNPGVTRVVNDLLRRRNRRWEFTPAPLAIGLPL